MSANIGKLTLLELRVLLEEIEAQIKRMETAEVAASAAKAPEAATRKKNDSPHTRDVSPLSEPAKVATPSDPGKTSSAANASIDGNASASIKYMHPVSRALFWDGLGKEPEWIGIYLDRGGSWAALENTAERFRRSLRSFEFPKKAG